MDVKESLSVEVVRSVSKKTISVGNPLLRKRSAAIEPAHITSLEIQTLLRDMVDAMRAERGIGLAAPQLGVPVRAIVVEIREENTNGVLDCSVQPLQAIINPAIEVADQGPVTGLEGCLSVPDYAGVVERPHAISVTGFDECGTRRRWSLSGWNARLLLHECDHLDGILYIDRVLKKDGELRLFRAKEFASVIDDLRAKKDVKTLAYYGRCLKKVT